MKSLYTEEKPTIRLFLLHSNLTDHVERIGFDTGCNAKLTDVLNGNEVIDVNGYYEIEMQPYGRGFLLLMTEISGLISIRDNTNCRAAEN